MSRSFQIIFSSRLFSFFFARNILDQGYRVINGHTSLEQAGTSVGRVGYKKNSFSNKRTQYWEHSGSGGDSGKLGVPRGPTAGPSQYVVAFARQGLSDPFVSPILTKCSLRTTYFLKRI